MDSMAMKRRMIPVMGRLGICGVLLAGIPAQAMDLAAAKGSGIGQEMKLNESLILKTDKVKSNKRKPKVAVEAPAESGKTVKPLQAADKTRSKVFKIRKLELRGDQDFFEKLGAATALRDAVEGRVLSVLEIQQLAKKYTKQLVDKGYYLASITTPPTDYTKGVLVYEVDMGRVGHMQFKQRSGTDQSGRAYRGRYFSEKQLRLRLTDIKEGEIFDYGTFYQAAYAINAHPDLTMDTDLKVRRDDGSYPPKRYVDMDFSVEEHMPLHAVLGFANSGTKATGDWRPSLTLQDVNLTKHDDVLSLNVGPLSLKPGEMTSFAGSYYLPYYIGKGGGVTLYGGYSDLDASDVVPDINLKGSGYFGGLQASYRLINNDAHLLGMSVGAVYRYVKDQLILAATDQEGEFATDPRAVSLVPFSLALSYSSGRADGLGGRNFLTLQTVANFEGCPGVSSEEEVQSLRADAKATYFIERVQVARVQPLWGHDETTKDGRTKERVHEWLVFIKADGQVASCALVPAEQKAIGGMDTVRGFPERIVMGDDSVSGSVELHTPAINTKINAAWLRQKSSLPEPVRLEFLAFGDGGYVSSRSPLEGETASYSLFSAGIGFRLLLTSYAQLRFDWGFPLSYDKDQLEQGEDPVQSYGRGHLAAQVQF